MEFLFSTLVPHPHQNMESFSEVNQKFKKLFVRMLESLASDFTMM